MNPISLAPEYIELHESDNKIVNTSRPVPAHRSRLASGSRCQKCECKVKETIKKIIVANDSYDIL